MKELLELSAQLRSTVQKYESLSTRRTEITYKKPVPSVKIKDLTPEEQAKVIYWLAHPKRSQS